VTITIFGQVIAKKNAKQLFMRGGKPMMVSSKNFLEWERDALKQLLQYRGTADGPVSLLIEIYNKDKRSRDLDNQAASILDVLVKSGLLEDDDCFHVRELHVLFGGVDKSPRAVINVQELNE
jgi:Holliday junction resolvase RusA-like endonuclease